MRVSEGEGGGVGRSFRFADETGGEGGVPLGRGADAAAGGMEGEMFVPGRVGNTVEEMIAELARIKERMREEKEAEEGKGEEGEEGEKKESEGTAIWDFGDPKGKGKYTGF